MTVTLQDLLNDAQKRTQRWSRQANGRYTIHAVSIAEPHNYDGDEFSQARQNDILKNTQEQEAEGGVWVGHPGFGDTEAPITGRMVNYRESSLGLGRHIADWVDLEPTTFLDIALARWRSYSVEYRLPNLDAYLGVALLGRSQAFFSFARLNLRVSDADMKKLRQDADSWPTTTANRSVRSVTNNSNSKGHRSMKKSYRQIMKDKLMVHQVRETDDDGKVGEWRNLRDGETVEKDDDDLRAIRAGVEEVGTRMGNLESRMEKVEESIGGGSDDGDDDDDKGRGADDGDDDDDKKKDDDHRSKKNIQAGRAVKANADGLRAMQKRLDVSEAKNVRNHFDAKLDDKVNAGAVIDKASRTATLDAVMAVEEDKRDDTFEALTKSIRTVPLTDDVNGEIKKQDDVDLSDYDEEEQKSVRTFMDKLGTNGRKVARKELKQFNKDRKANPEAHGYTGGPANWLEANIVPGEHDVM